MSTQDLSAQEKVVEALSDGRWHTAAEIGKATGLGSDAMDALARLEDIGAVECDIINGRPQYCDAARTGRLKPQPRKSPGPNQKLNPSQRGGQYHSRNCRRRPCRQNHPPAPPNY